jgi:hypothetical protein
MRISYEYIPAGGDVSVIGVQEEGISFRPFDHEDATREISIKKMNKHHSKIREQSWTKIPVEFIYQLLVAFRLIDSKLDDTVLLVEERLTDMETMFADAKFKLTKKMIFIRIISCFLLGLGLYYILDPISYLFFWFPFLQSVIENMFFLVSMLFGIVVGTTIISLAWLQYHPQYLAVILLVLGSYFITASYSVGLTLLIFAIYPIFLTIDHFIEEWRYNNLIESEKRDELSPMIDELKLQSAKRPSAKNYNSV